PWLAVPRRIRAVAEAVMLGISMYFNVCGFKVIIWSSAWIGTDSPTATAVPSMMSSAAIRLDRMAISIPIAAASGRVCPVEPDPPIRGRRSTLDPLGSDRGDRGPLPPAPAARLAHQRRTVVRAHGVTGARPVNRASPHRPVVATGASSTSVALSGCATALGTIPTTRPRSVNATSGRRLFAGTSVTADDSQEGDRSDGRRQDRNCGDDHGATQH